MTISLPEQSPQQRQRARIAGWLMALTFLTSIPAALILYDPVLNDTDYILGAGDDTRVTLGRTWVLFGPPPQELSDTTRAPGSVARR
jgi:hypothetical protein